MMEETSDMESNSLDQITIEADKSQGKWFELQHHLSIESDLESFEQNEMASKVKDEDIETDPVQKKHLHKNSTSNAAVDNTNDYEDALVERDEYVELSRRTTPSFYVVETVEKENSAVSGDYVSDERLGKVDKDALQKEYDTQWYALEELKSTLQATSHLPSETLNGISVFDVSDIDIHEDSIKGDLDNVPLSGNYFSSVDDQIQEMSSSHSSKASGCDINFPGNQNGMPLMERPEPLGKARQDMDHVKQPGNVSRADQDINVDSEADSYMNIMQFKDDREQSSSTSQNSETRISLEEVNFGGKDFAKQYGDGLVSTIEQILSSRGVLERQQSSSSSSFLSSSISVGSYQGIPLSNAVTRSPVSALLRSPSQTSKQVLNQQKDRNINFMEQLIPVSIDDVSAINWQGSPLSMATDVLKASTLLSAKTEKSLKMANDILKVIEEQRTPATMSSLSSEDLDTDSAVVSTEALITEENDTKVARAKSTGHLNSYLISSDGQSENTSLSVEIKFRDERMQLLKHALSDSSKTSTVQDSSNMYSTPVSDTSTDFFQKPVLTSSLNKLCQSQNIYATFDSTSSELMRLKASNDSSLFSSFPKSHGPDEPDFSPIDPVMQFTNADDNVKNGNGIPSLSTSTLKNRHPHLKTNSSSRVVRDLSTDTEIEKLHRSLGAGTVTPLPYTRADQIPSLKGDRKKTTSTPLNGDSVVSHTSSEITRDYDNSDDKCQARTSPDLSSSTLSSQGVTTDSGVVKLRAGNSTSSVSSVSPSLNSSSDKSSHSDNEKRHLSNGLIDGDGRGRKRLNTIPEMSNWQLDQSSNSATFHSRGVYDIRDSSGPGSTNRKRKIQGKKPLSTTNNRKDPLNVYVSDGSRATSSLSSTRKENSNSGLRISHETKQDVRIDRDYLNTEGKGNQVNYNAVEGISLPFVSGRLASSSVTVDSGSSSFDSDDTDVLVSARVGVMPKKSFDYKTAPRSNISYTTQEEHKPQMDRNKYRSVSVYPIASDLLRTRQNQHSNPVTSSHQPAMKSTLARCSKSEEPKRKPPHSNINELWEKFQSSFSPGGRHSIIENKISTLSNLISHKNKIPSVEAKTTTSKHRITSERSLNEARPNDLPSKSIKDAATSYFTPIDNTEIVAGKANGHASTEGCIYCHKRDKGTNFPTPQSKSGSRHQHTNEPPLLLQTWTQTTPNPDKYGREVVFVEKAYNNSEKGSEYTHAGSKPHGGGNAFGQNKTNFLRSSSKNKENTSFINQHTSSSSPGNPKSWTVYFGENERKNKPVKSANRKKPPLQQQQHRLSDVDKLLQEKPQQQNKRKPQPVYTAWFQSTRSDTSEGTIVPLSDVPTLSQNYKEKREPKMYIEERISNVQQSLSRLSLQEAFQLAKRDFIDRSKKRVIKVKEVKRTLKERKRLTSLKEQHFIDDVNHRNAKRDTKIDLLLRRKKRQINKQEMFEQNRRMYDKLPEVVQMREEEKKQQEYQQNRLKLKQFDKKLRKHLMKNKRHRY